MGWGLGSAPEAKVIAFFADGVIPAWIIFFKRNSGRPCQTIARTLWVFGADKRVPNLHLREWIFDTGLPSNRTLWGNINALFNNEIRDVVHVSLHVLIERYYQIGSDSQYQNGSDRNKKIIRVGMSL